jgi:hypothetical protein
MIGVLSIYRERKMGTVIILVNYCNCIKNLDLSPPLGKLRALHSTPTTVRLPHAASKKEERDENY